jgi:hypothetical protein
MTITEFLTARYDEEEAEARAATPGPWRAADAGEYGAEVYTADGKTAVACSREGGGVDLEDATHIARHDPARVLREVAAGRTILGALEAAGDLGRDDRDLMFAVRVITAVYADHPDYRQEWAP